MRSFRVEPEPGEVESDGVAKRFVRDRLKGVFEPLGDQFVPGPHWFVVPERHAYAQLLSFAQNPSNVHVSSLRQEPSGARTIHDLVVCGVGWIAEVTQLSQTVMDCSLQECSEPTADKRPFCVDHLWCCERTEKLRAEVESRGKEITKVTMGKKSGWKYVDVMTSRMAQEILQKIELLGPMTINDLRMATDLNTKIVVAQYVKAWERVGVLKTKKMKFGRSEHVMVSLVTHSD